MPILDLNTPVSLATNDGIGENRRGSQEQPVPYPPNPGDGENSRGATRPENIPAGMYLVVPPIGWKDSGIPGLFVNEQSPFYPLKPLQINEAEIRVRISFPMASKEIPSAMQVIEKVRFNQKLLFENLRIQGIHPLGLDTLTNVKLLWLTCVVGEGTVKINGGAALPIKGRPLSLDFDPPDTQHSTFAFLNYTGGVGSVIFDGDAIVTAVAFQ